LSARVRAKTSTSGGVAHTDRRLQRRAHRPQKRIRRLFEANRRRDRRLAAAPQLGDLATARLERGIGGLHRRREPGIRFGVLVGTIDERVIGPAPDLLERRPQPNENNVSPTNATPSSGIK
jgi:hypothetical protein